MHYISLQQSQELDKAIKSIEVAFRSFIADILITDFPNENSLRNALNSLTISNDFIYSRKFNAKKSEYLGDLTKIYKILSDSKLSLDNKTFSNNVPYVSDLVNLLLLFFNTHFVNKNIAQKFSTIDEFHYCCVLYHKTRNNLSHPASHPIVDIDANKLLYFIKNLVVNLDDIYFWFDSKTSILGIIDDYKNLQYKTTLKYNNLKFAKSTHKSLLSRDEIIKKLYDSLLGIDLRKRLSGSVVLFGYGGVGKTAITTEFLYRLVRDKLDGEYEDLEYILFFSSKDEYLKENQTTGELYIDSVKPEYSTLEELIILINKTLEIDNINEIETKFERGIIAIDNIENIIEEEKNKILEFIKTLPRNVQFIVTSRNEEACEEKIHIEEFKNDSLGKEFVSNLIDSEEFDINLDKNEIEKLLLTSRGNVLIIIQILNIVSRSVSTFQNIITTIDNTKSKETEAIANFMYKNTFDKALKALKIQKFPVIEVMQIISLYKEPIELYSISKLNKITVIEAERICNYLSERLILNKNGEYYELNEFARRFVFIKLLPDRFELSKIKDKIKTHKKRMQDTIESLDKKLENNSKLNRNVLEWQPRNYIDKITIAEIFPIYGNAVDFAMKNKFSDYKLCLKEFEEHSYISNHPYVPLQKARILIAGYYKFYQNDTTILDEIEASFEQAIENIEYEYTYLYGGLAHASLLMFFGLFLNKQLKDDSRAIRFLEEAKKYYADDRWNGWFTTCNALSKAYEYRFNQTKDNAYMDQLKKVVNEVINENKNNIDIDRFKKTFSKYI